MSSPIEVRAVRSWSDLRAFIDLPYRLHAGTPWVPPLRLERWLGVDHGGSASVWLGMEAAYDLWHAQKAARPALTKIKSIKHEELAA